MFPPIDVKTISPLTFRGREGQVARLAMLVTVVAMWAVFCLIEGRMDLIAAMDAVLGTSVMSLIG